MKLIGGLQMRSNILKVVMCLFFCAILLVPATYATTDMSKNALQTSDHNTPIRVGVLTHHINQVDPG